MSAVPHHNREEEEERRDAREKNRDPTRGPHGDVFLQGYHRGFGVLFRHAAQPCECVSMLSKGSVRRLRGRGDRVACDSIGQASAAGMYTTYYSVGMTQVLL